MKPWSSSWRRYSLPRMLAIGNRSLPTSAAGTRFPGPTHSLHLLPADRRSPGDAVLAAGSCTNPIPSFVSLPPSRWGCSAIPRRSATDPASDRFSATGHGDRKRGCDRAGQIGGRRARISLPVLWAEPSRSLKRTQRLPWPDAAGDLGLGQDAQVAPLLPFADDTVGTFGGARFIRLAGFVRRGRPII